jgi:hypothetical protein
MPLDDEPWTPRSLFVPTLLVALALAAPATMQQRLTLVGTPPTPFELLDRARRASEPGGYVDVHGPLSAAEAALVSGYRDAEGRPIAAGR